MGKLYDAIDDKLRGWIEAQRVFFVATAPGEGGHVNCSPKGLDSLRVLGPHRVAWLDFIGSGAETIAHLRDNGRVTLMFCAFEGPPKIVRLYGVGSVQEPGDADFDSLAADFPVYGNTRSIIAVEVQRIADSCGYGVPVYRFEEERAQLGAWSDRKGPDGLLEYQLDHNLESIDGLPALRGQVPRRLAKG